MEYWSLTPFFFLVLLVVFALDDSGVYIQTPQHEIEYRAKFADLFIAAFVKFTVCDEDFAPATFQKPHHYPLQNFSRCPLLIRFSPELSHRPLPAEDIRVC